MTNGKPSNDRWKEWDKEFDDECRKQLRDITRELSDRLLHLFELMFKPDQNIGWQSWLLKVCSDSVCRQAFGIPAQYDQQQISSILMGTLPGLPRTFTSALRMRIEIAFNLLAKVIVHPLCPVSLRRFAKDFHSVRESLRRESQKNGGKWLTPDCETLFRETKFLALSKKCDDNRVRMKLRQLLRHFRQTQLDSEYYALLLALDSARLDPKLKGMASNAVDEPSEIMKKQHMKYYQKASRKLLKCLLELASHDDFFESDVVPWWCAAEIFHDDTMTSFPEPGGEKLPSKEAGWRRILEYLRKEIPGDNHPSTVYDIEEYSEIQCFAFIQIATAAMTVFQYCDGSKGEFSGLAKNSLKYTKQVLAGDSGKNEQRRIEDDDHGFLAIMTTKLFCLLEFWKWQTLHEAIGCVLEISKDGGMSAEGKSDKRVFGSSANEPMNRMRFAWPIWKEIKGLPSLHYVGGKNKLKQNSDDPVNLEDMKGIEYSVVLLGSPGIGKGAIVEELWLFNELKDDKGGDKMRREQKVFYINKTPYEIDSHWLECEGEEYRDSTEGSRTIVKFAAGEKEQVPDFWFNNKKEQPNISGQSNYYLIFIDEVHLPSAVSPYGLLLKPIQEGHSKLRIMGKDRAVYVFATSAYRNKEHFEKAAAEQNNAAMRDFATRIKKEHWVVLPDLCTVPEQIYLLVHSMLTEKFEKKKEKGLTITEDDEKKAPAKIKTVATRFMTSLRFMSTREIIGALKEYEDEIVKVDEDDRTFSVLIPKEIDKWRTPAIPDWAIERLDGCITKQADSTHNRK